MDEIFMTERQLRAAEYFMEHQRLTSDLVDDQARPLIQWASYQAALAAGDPERTDEELDTIMQSIRRAIRWVVANAADEFDPERLVALANQAREREG